MNISKRFIELVLSILLSTAQLGRSAGVQSSQAEILPDGQLDRLKSIQASVAQLHASQDPSMDAIRDRLKSSRNLNIMRREGLSKQDEENEDENEEDRIAAEYVQQKAMKALLKSQDPPLTNDPAVPYLTLPGYTSGVNAAQYTPSPVTDPTTTLPINVGAAAVKSAIAARTQGKLNVTVNSTVNASTTPLYMKYNTTAQELSGVAMCENRGMDQSQCAWFGCCKWDNGVCLSNVGWDVCRMDATGIKMCENQNWNERECHFVGCCVYNHSAPLNQSCRSAVGDDTCIRIRVVPPPAPAPVPLPAALGTSGMVNGVSTTANVGSGDYQEMMMNMSMQNQATGGFNPFDPSDASNNPTFGNPSFKSDQNYQGTDVIKLEDGSVVDPDDTPAEDASNDVTVFIKQPPPRSASQIAAEADPLANMPPIGTMVNGGAPPMVPLEAGSMGAYGPVLPDPPLPQLGPGGIPIFDAPLASKGNFNADGSIGDNTTGNASVMGQQQDQISVKRKDPPTSLLVLILTGVALCCGCQAVCLVGAFVYYRSVNKPKPFHDLYAAAGKEIPKEWHEDDEVLVDYDVDKDDDDDDDDGVYDELQAEIAQNPMSGAASTSAPPS